MFLCIIAENILVKTTEKTLFRYITNSYTQSLYSENLKKMPSVQQPELLIECHQLYIAFIKTESMIFRRLFAECACMCGFDESSIKVLCQWYDAYPIELYSKAESTPTSFSQEAAAADNTSFTSSGYSTELFVGSHIIGL